jgi:ubiquinone/menaquinone biosynthesis C-methylase UbiE
MNSRQAVLDRKNSEFWDELCGSAMARGLGINKISKKALRKYDDHYLSFYPYLKKYFFSDEIKGKKVLDIGPAFGTPGQVFMNSGADYYAIDIARKPVEMIDYRKKIMNRINDRKAIQASALNIPFKDSSFDYVFALGVIHHTGNMKKSLSEIYRLLKCP